MARTIDNIHGDIVAELRSKVPNLSTSKVAQWRLITYVVAAAIHAFEVVLDLFYKEISERTSISTSGTIAWYAETCRRFQFGHKLVFDSKTASYGYAYNDSDSRIIKVVAVTERDRALYIKVAKLNDAGDVIPLSDVEYRDFVSYIDFVCIAGHACSVISTTADSIMYGLDVYYSSAYPLAAVRYAVDAALAKFRTKLSFDAKVYQQRLLDAVMSAEGVVTVNPRQLKHRTAAESVYEPMGIATELAAGYFDYDSKSVINYLPVNDM